MLKDYRLGIDLGSTSLGWCMVEIDPDKNPIAILGMGVRIFPDGRKPKSKEPLSVQRRVYRSARKNLDRYLLRIRNLIEYLMTHDFLPKDEQRRSEIFSINPYKLRTKGLDEKLEPAEFARAIIHLAKKRGFKSNRKTDSDAKTAYTEAIQNLQNQLQQSNARTLGEYLWKKYQNVPSNQEHLRKSIKFRYEKSDDNLEPIFPTRDIVEHEFDKIWEKQAILNPIFTEEHKTKIKDIIFHQRPLKPTQKGKCQLLPQYERAPKAHPMFQEFRIRQDLNNLRLVDVFSNRSLDLTHDQRETLYKLLSTKDKCSLASMRKKLFAKQFDDYRFSIESESKKDLKGDLLYHAFHKKDNPELGELWDTLSVDTQAKVVELLISELNDESVIAKLVDLDIPARMAEAMINTKLPESYSHLSVEALSKILPFLRDGKVFSEACSLAGLHHSLEYNGVVYQDGNLPYYGEILRRETLELNRKIGDPDADEHGKINNPSVHIALNQLRKLVNTLSKCYGAPYEIVLELGKELKLSSDKLDETNKLIAKNTKINEDISQKLRENGITVNHENILRVKLWEELARDEIDRRCIYSGKQISFADLFTPRFEIEHILPKSRTYDDGTANKTISYYEANRYKGERSPFEAFGDSRDGYNWQDIVTRSNKMPHNKKWRFEQSAMDKFQDDNEVLARMLNDTKYMSRVAMKYMMYVCGNDRVWTITGRHTAMLRGKWGLNSALGDTQNKNRSDHRHHAIDAFVIALTTRSFVKNLATNIRNSRERFIERLPLPYPDFDHDVFKASVDKIKVSIKPDHVNIGKLHKKNQTAGALTEDTAYSFVAIDPEDKKYSLYCVRKSVMDLNLKKIDDIVSPDLRIAIQALADCSADEKEFKSKLHAWAKQQNVKKLKMLMKAKPETMIPVKDKDGRIYKYYSSGENLFADIYIKDPANPQIKWDIEIVNSYNFHRQDFVPQWKKDYPKAKKVMRLYKNDIVAIDTEDGHRELRRVKKMSKGILYLRLLNISTRERSVDDVGEQFSPNQLLLKRARKAGVDIIGRAFDPIVNEDDNRA